MNIKELIEQTRMPITALHDVECFQYQICADDRVIATGIESVDEASMIVHCVNNFMRMLEALETVTGGMTAEEVDDACTNGVFLGGALVEQIRSAIASAKEVE